MADSSTNVTIASSAPTPSLGARLVRFVLAESALTLLVALIVVCTLLSRNFLTGGNLANLADQIPIFAILAAGQLLVILTGGIDLSVGSVLALTAFFAAACSFHGLVPGVVAPLAVGGFIGMLNGLGAAYTRVPPFIITLAMLSIARGLALQAAAWYHGGSVTGAGASPVSASPDFGFPLVSSGNVFGLPVAALIAIAVFALLAYVLRYEPFGRHVYAVGGNEAAALLLGVNVKRVKILVYTISGALAGLAGVLYASRELSAPPTAAERIRARCDHRGRRRRHVADGRRRHGARRDPRAAHHPYLAEHLQPARPRPGLAASRSRRRADRGRPPPTPDDRGEEQGPTRSGARDTVNGRQTRSGALKLDRACRRAGDDRRRRGIELDAVPYARGRDEIVELTRTLVVAPS